MTHAEGQLTIPYGVLVVAKDPVRVPTGRRLPGLDGSTALAVRRRRHGSTSKDIWNRMLMNSEAVGTMPTRAKARPSILNTRIGIGR